MGHWGSTTLILKRSFEAKIGTPQDQMPHRNIEHWPLAHSKDKAIEKVPNKKSMELLHATQ